MQPDDEPSNDRVFTVNRSISVMLTLKGTLNPSTSVSRQFPITKWLHMTWRLFKYAQWLTRKRFLTSKLYKSANADIVVGSSRHTALATPHNIARPLRPITCCCRGFGAIISQNRTDWCIRMQRMSLTC